MKIIQKEKEKFMFSEIFLKLKNWQNPNVKFEAIHVLNNRQETE